MYIFIDAISAFYRSLRQLIFRDTGSAPADVARARCKRAAALWDQMRSTAVHPKLDCLVALLRSKLVSTTLKSENGRAVCSEIMVLCHFWKVSDVGEAVHVFGGSLQQTSLQKRSLARALQITPACTTLLSTCLCRLKLHAQTVGPVRQHSHGVHSVTLL